MKIFYDYWQDLWFVEDKEGITFGASKERLPVKGESEWFSATLQNSHGNCGPLIGILVSRNGTGSLSGSHAFFSRLQREALARGGLTIVFPPDSLGHAKTKGWIFHPDKEKWFPATTPLPHIVYNRIASREAEKAPEFHKALHLMKEWSIPLFNPSFIDKYELYSILSKNSFIAKHLPKTILAADPDKLEHFLDEFESLYLKPSMSSRGNGLMRLKRSNGKITTEGIRKKTKYDSFFDFWDSWKDIFLEKKYIAQEEIIPAKLDGKRFDFRAHVHDGPKGYQLTGIGIRLAQNQDLTTHLPLGGAIVPYEKVRSESHDLFLSRLAAEVGNSLSSHLGYFGELSIDAGLRESGEYILYEINSKPMNFDEPHIEAARINSLVDLLFRKSKFS